MLLILERKTNNGDSKLGTFVGAGNNQVQAVAVKRQGAHTFLAVPVLPTRWTSLQGCAESEKLNRSSKAFTLTQKSICQTWQTLETHCPKDLDVFREGRREYRS